MTTLAMATLQVALPSNPTEPDVFFDLTHRLRELPLDRGRQGTDAAVSAGTVRVTLDNSDRHLDQSYAAGPYSGWLLVGRRCRTGTVITDGASSYAGAVRDRGPVAYWLLGEPLGTALAYDQVGGVSGLHGTYAGGVALDQAGLVATAPDTAALFDASNDTAALPAAAALNLTGPITIVVWVKTTSTGAGTLLGGYQNGSPFAGYGVRLNNGKLEYWSGTAFAWVGPTTPLLNDGLPHHAVVSVSGTSAAFYVDGVPAGTHTTAQPNSYSGVRAIGSRAGGAADFFGGTLGHLALYDRALTAADAADLYAAGQGYYEPRFEGYLDPFTGTREGFSGARVEFPASDGLSILANADVSGDRPEEPADERVGAVLDAAAWTTGEPSWILGHPVLSNLGVTTWLGPRGARALDTASSVLQATTLDGTAGPHLQDAERSEQGFAFVARTGEYTFHSRQRRVLAGMQPPRAIFGDRPFEDGGELPFVDVILEDGTELYNHVSVSRQNGETHEVSDAASQLVHWKRSMPGFSVSVATEGDALAIAQYKLFRHKDQRKRIRQLVLNPHAASGGLFPTLMRVIAGSELGDLYEVRVRPPGGGDPIIALVHLEHISEHWVYGGVSARYESVVWTLSEADSTQYWWLGDPARSVLSATTTLAWIG
jgi:hypothetical protein